MNTTNKDSRVQGFKGSSEKALKTKVNSEQFINHYSQHLAS